MKEPIEAFPYKPPSNKIKENYKHIFELKKPLKDRIIKVFFDKIISLILLLFGIPILIILKISYIIEGYLYPENSGPLIFYYNAVSRGTIFRKYKIRLVKLKYIDSAGAKKGEWAAFSAEWNKDSRTYTGAFVKKFYLDEIPQLFNILKGEMSIVGPRPLAEIHYERDKNQGNVTRYLLKGGLLGMGHIMKGQSSFGDPVYEYKYIEKYINSSSLSLLVTDLSIIMKGILVVFKGKGL